MMSRVFTLIVLVAVNLFIPLIVGGMIFGVVLAIAFMRKDGLDHGMIHAVIGSAFLAIISAVFGFLNFLVPGLIYSLCVSLVSMFRLPGRRFYVVGISLLAGIVVYPLWLKTGKTGFHHSAWLIGLITTPLCVATAVIFDRLEKSLFPTGTYRGVGETPVHPGG
jgi:hypothetical protein